MAKTVQVLSVCDEFCIDQGTGEKLHAVLADELKRDEKIVLDFSGVKVTCPPFIGQAFGQLFLTCPNLSERLAAVNLPDEAQFNRAFEHAHRYFTDEWYRFIIDRTNERMMAEMDAR